MLGRICLILTLFEKRDLNRLALARLEGRLKKTLDEFGLTIIDFLLNSQESDEFHDSPVRIVHQGEHYRRRRKTPKIIATLFGQFQLRRRLYEAYEAGVAAIHPYAIMLGLVAGVATPMLAEKVGRLAASCTQSAVLYTLSAEYHVKWSVGLLRKVVAELAAALDIHRHEIQVRLLLGLLQKANRSKGRRKIVLAVGRDGIHLPMCEAGKYREGAVGTFTVYDRRGRRLGTAYLAHMPEAFQVTLSKQMTELLQSVLSRWDGPLPRLAYITDAGWHPSDYYKNVLRRMRHPRTGQELSWYRVVDYYHAAERITKLRDVLFGKDAAAGHAWARRMRSVLKSERNGIRRLLHSAAALRKRRELSRSAEETYSEAYQYLSGQRAYLRYWEYRAKGLPIGSGVTEAACKTVFTQRFKQSGMGWKVESGETILKLRVLYLSGVWDAAFRAWLNTGDVPHNGTEPYLKRPTKPPLAPAKRTNHANSGGIA